MLHLARAGFAVSCFAPFMEQHDVVDHHTGNEVAEFRNVLIESARISRGAIAPLTELNEADFDCLVLPGGFGVAKNFTKWAFLGASGGIHPLVRDVIRAFVSSHRPVMALGMASTTVAKAVQSLDCSARLTVGSTEASSPSSILEIASILESTGAHHIPCLADEACVDEDNRIVTIPCYMMETDILGVERGIEAGVREIVRLSDAAAVSRITAIPGDDISQADSVQENPETDIATALGEG